MGTSSFTINIRANIYSIAGTGLDVFVSDRLFSFWYSVFERTISLCRMATVELSNISGGH